jgi:ferredoxin--NADP+ reductase
MCWAGAAPPTSFTTKELRELGQLPDVQVIVRAADLELDPSSRAVVEQNKVAARNVAVLQEWATRRPTGASLRIHFHFWTRPVMIIGDGRVAAVRTERTMIDTDGLVTGTGDLGTLDAQLIVRSVGYRGLALPGLPYDEAPAGAARRGPVIRDHGFSAEEYVASWIKRGPTGVIGTNKSDATETVNSLLGAIRDGAVVAHGRSGDLDRLLAAAESILDLRAWHRIDDAEIARGASHGRRRTTLAHRSELLAATRSDHGPGRRRRLPSTPFSSRLGSLVVQLDRDRVEDLEGVDALRLRLRKPTSAQLPSRCCTKGAANRSGSARNGRARLTSTDR